MMHRMLVVETSNCKSYINSMVYVPSISSDKLFEIHTLLLFSEGLLGDQWLPPHALKNIVIWDLHHGPDENSDRYIAAIFFSMTEAIIKIFCLLVVKIVRFLYKENLLRNVLLQNINVNCESNDWFRNA